MLPCIFYKHDNIKRLINKTNSLKFSTPPQHHHGISRFPTPGTLVSPQRALEDLIYQIFDKKRLVYDEQLKIDINLK